MKMKRITQTAKQASLVAAVVILAIATASPARADTMTLTYYPVESEIKVVDSAQPNKNVQMTDTSNNNQASGTTDNTGTATLGNGSFSWTLNDDMHAAFPGQDFYFKAAAYGATTEGKVITLTSYQEGGTPPPKTQSTVPAPAAFLLLGPGLVGLGAMRRRFKR